LGFNIADRHFKFLLIKEIDLGRQFLAVGAETIESGQAQFFFKELQQLLLLMDNVIFLLECLEQFRYRWRVKNRRFLL